jgi:ring-1,2-phenylacetyl-CoA epoxidase subunit PaaE
MGHLVMVAAGSGVTPFISIMREHAHKLGQKGSPKKMTLLVSYRSRQDLILASDLASLKKTPGCSVFITLSRDPGAPNEFWHGRITGDMITRAIGGDFNDSTFMSCGPTAIMDLTCQVARESGVPESQIKKESFES